jgi:galactokinase
VHTTVPLGGGLSSSAALETATSVALEALNGVALDEVQRALLSQRAEREFVGVNCGILDQFTSSAGKAQSVLLLDCRTIEGKSVPMDESLRVVICDTRAKRALATSQYGERRAACEEAAHRLSALLPNVRTLRDVSAEAFAPLAATLPAEPAKRARFIIEEDERVLALASALAEGDRSAIATLAAASFAGARDLYEITVPEMERMLEAMLGAPGVVGARQAGAGFGGCMVAFVDAAQVDAFGREVATAYEAATGITPAIYPVEAAAGAGALPGFVSAR